MAHLFPIVYNNTIYFVFFLICGTLYNKFSEIFHQKPSPPLQIISFHFNCTEIICRSFARASSHFEGLESERKSSKLTFVEWKWKLETEAWPSKPKSKENSTLRKNCFRSSVVQAFLYHYFNKKVWLLSLLKYFI